MSAGYQLVQLQNGTWSVRSLAEAETFHPVVGPVAEAEALYVNQLRLRERFADAGNQEFVLWDVGLGAAANVLTALRALQATPGRIRVLSFDHTLEPLRFAVTHAVRLGYFENFVPAVETLLAHGSTAFTTGVAQVSWEVFVADFPTLLASAAAEQWPTPHAILFDAYSPARNPAMWTLPLFTRLRELAADEVPCALSTYSRATLLRVTLLRAGWFVGAGHATGEKDETTLAANQRQLIAEPLDETWLRRAYRSTSAEPLLDACYRQQALSELSRTALQTHAQFAPDRGPTNSADR